VPFYLFSLTPKKKQKKLKTAYDVIGEKMVKVHLYPDAKQRAISAFAQWIRETGQKSDRYGGH